MKNILTKYINNIKSKFSKYIVFFPLLSSIGFISASILSFNSLCLYSIFAIISLAVVAYKFYKNKKYLGNTIILLIIFLGTDMYIWNNSKSLDSEYKSLYQKCKNNSQCNKKTLDSSYNNYIHYKNKINNLKGTEMCKFIASEMPKIYEDFNLLSNLVVKSNGFIDFYINDFYNCLKPLSKSEIKDFYKANITTLENYSIVYKKIYFNLNDKYTGSNLDSRNKINFILKSSQL